MVPARHERPQIACQENGVKCKHSIRVTVLLSSVCRATVESLPSVHSSSATDNSDRATSLDANCSLVPRRVLLIPNTTANHAITYTKTISVSQCYLLCCFWRLSMFSAPMRPIASVNRKLQTGHPSTVFSVVSYNVLAQDLLHKNQYLYTHCPPELLSWEYRKWNILNELVESTADVSVLCLYLQFVASLLLWLLWLLTTREGFSRYF